jgi:Secretion system C-terminal sorting domain/Reeler domain
MPDIKAGIKLCNMKKQLLLTTMAGAACLLILRGNAAGPAFVNSYDCTGAESAGVGVYQNPTGCSAGGSCHGGVGASTAAVLVGIAIDSMGVPVTHYKAGMVYNVTITGTNTTGSSLPFYGFQLAALKGAASTSSNADAGTWPTTGLPAQTRHTAPSASGTQLTVMEHSSRISVPSPGTVFTETFSWTAPVAGTGTISFWGAANFVNGDGLASGLDKWNTGSTVVGEWTIPAAVDAVTEAGFAFYPNPVSGTLYLVQAANATVVVYDLTGRVRLTQQMGANAADATLDMSALEPGIYELRATKDIDGTRVVKTFALLHQ